MTINAYKKNSVDDFLNSVIELVSTGTLHVQGVVLLPICVITQSMVNQ